MSRSYTTTSAVARHSAGRALKPYVAGALRSLARSALVSILVLATLLGCSQNPRTQLYIDSVNAEKRLLEDKLYILQDDYDAKVEELQALRKQLADLKRGKGLDNNEDAAPAPFRLIPRPKTKEPDIDGLVPPTIEPGQPAGDTQAPAKPDGNQKTGDLDKLLQPPSLDMGHEVSSVSALQLPTDRVVTNIVVEPAAVASAPPEESNAESCFHLLLCPKNKAGQIVPEAGRATIVLLDPVERSRVERWELDAKQVKAAIEQSTSDRGIQLDLPWQDAAPSKDHLHLFVRFWPGHGELVEVDREITLASSDTDTVVSRWTPRAPAPDTQTPAAASVAERPVDESTVTPPPTTPSGPGSKPEQTTPSLTRSTENLKQASRPQWRPYR